MGRATHHDSRHHESEWSLRVTTRHSCKVVFGLRIQERLGTGGKTRAGSAGGNEVEDEADSILCLSAMIRRREVMIYIQIYTYTHQSIKPTSWSTLSPFASLVKEPARSPHDTGVLANDRLPAYSLRDPGYVHPRMQDPRYVHPRTQDPAYNRDRPSAQPLADTAKLRPFIPDRAGDEVDVGLPNHS